ncbi:MAG: ribosome maturation factor RimP [Gammaproteobacteria bacterium]|jgi:ribosome maturation factor RimP
MRTAPANVQNLIEPVISALGYELVGVEYISQGRRSLLRIYIDHSDGINVHDCERVSHQVSGVLDVEDVIRGQYTLEVSSPGLDRPLFTKEQFERYIGSEVNIRLSIAQQGRKKFKGILRGIDDTNVFLNVDEEEISLPFNAIEKANLVPVF